MDGLIEKKNHFEMDRTMENGVGSMSARPNCGLLRPLPTYNRHTKCFMVYAMPRETYNLFGYGQNAILHTICHTDGAATTWRIKKPSLVSVVVTPHSGYARRTIPIPSVCGCVRSLYFILFGSHCCGFVLDAET